MARRNNTQRKPVGALQRLHDQSQAEDAQRPLVNEHAAQHGDYTRHLRFVINRGGTAIDRWTRDGQLSETQQAAILHCRRLWNIVGAGPRLVANLDRTVFGCPGDGHGREIEARDDLNRIRDYFRHPLTIYFDVFENVCRFDEPAGVAGSRLAADNRAATARAHQVVCFVADTIYTNERLSY